MHDDPVVGQQDLARYLTVGRLTVIPQRPHAEARQRDQRRDECADKSRTRRSLHIDGRCLAPRCGSHPLPMLPISLRADGRRALIVGGGNVARRKAEALLEAGFALTVIAPSIDARVRALCERPDGVLLERAYATGDLGDAALVIAATDRPEVNAAVLADARAAR